MFGSGAMNPDMSACCESDYAGTMKRCCECHDLLNYNQRGHCCCVWSSLVSVMSSQHILDSEIQCAQQQQQQQQQTLAPCFHAKTGITGPQYTTVQHCAAMIGAASLLSSWKAPHRHRRVQHHHRHVCAALLVVLNTYTNAHLALAH